MQKQKIAARYYKSTSQINPKINALVEDMNDSPGYKHKRRKRIYFSYLFAFLATLIANVALYFTIWEQFEGYHLVMMGATIISFVIGGLAVNLLPEPN